MLWVRVRVRVRVALGLGYVPAGRDISTFPLGVKIQQERRRLRGDSMNDHGEIFTATKLRFMLPPRGGLFILDTDRRQRQISARISHAPESGHILAAHHAKC